MKELTNGIQDKRREKMWQSEYIELVKRALGKPTPRSFYAQHQGWCNGAEFTELAKKCSYRNRANDKAHDKPPAMAMQPHAAAALIQRWFKRYGDRRVLYRAVHYTCVNTFKKFTYWGQYEGEFIAPGKVSTCFRKYNERYTGFTTIDGQDIFEGDYLGGWPHGMVQVVWDAKWGTWQAVAITDEGKPTGQGMDLLANELEACRKEWVVVGNRHEGILLNPDKLHV